MDSDAISSLAVLLILVTALISAVLLALLILLVLTVGLLLLLAVRLVLLPLLVLLTLLVLLLLLLLVLLRFVLLILLRSHYVHPVELLMCAVERCAYSPMHTACQGTSGRFIPREPRLSSSRNASRLKTSPHALPSR